MTTNRQSLTPSSESIAAPEQPLIGSDEFSPSVRVRPSRLRGSQAQGGKRHSFELRVLRHGEGGREGAHQKSVTAVFASDHHRHRGGGGGGGGGGAREGRAAPWEFQRSTFIIGFSGNQSP